MAAESISPPPELAAVAGFALACHAARTPLLLLDRQAISGQVDLWRRCLPSVVPHYAVKVNDFPPILEQLHAEGVWFDAATAGEIELLAALGVPPAHVIVTHPIRDARDLDAVRRYQPRALIVQDADELQKLRGAGIPSRSYAPEILVRIKLEFSNLNKFGVEGVFEPRQKPDGTWTWSIDARPLREVFATAQAIERETGCSFAGFGFAGHVGTNTVTPEPYRMMLAGFRYLQDKLGNDGIAITCFDLGGGYCDPEAAAQHGTTQAELLQGIAAVVAETAAACPGVRLLAEPGRFMVSHAATLVTAVKSVRKKDWRIMPMATAAGERVAAVQSMQHLVVHMDDSIYGTLLGQVHDDKQWQFVAVRLQGEPHAGPLVPALIWGATCDSWDRVHGDRDLPADLRAGDHLLVPHVGAYAMATRTDFNRMAPQLVFAFDREPAPCGNWILFDHAGTVLERAR